VLALHRAKGFRFIQTDGNSIKLPGHTFHFHRQRKPDGLCLSDYINPQPFAAKGWAEWLHRRIREDLPRSISGLGFTS
jgi:cobalamin-dependent methionine synthase I